MASAKLLEGNDGMFIDGFCLVLRIDICCGVVSNLLGRMEDFCKATRLPASVKKIIFVYKQ